MKIKVQIAYREYIEYRYNDFVDVFLDEKEIIELAAVKAGENFTSFLPDLDSSKIISVENE